MHVRTRHRSEALHYYIEICFKNREEVSAIDDLHLTSQTGYATFCVNNASVTNVNERRHRSSIWLEILVFQLVINFKTEERDIVLSNYAPRLELKFKTRYKQKITAISVEPLLLPETELSPRCPPLPC